MSVNNHEKIVHDDTEEEVKIEEVKENSLGFDYASSNEYYSPHTGGKDWFTESVNCE